MRGDFAKLLVESHLRGFATVSLFKTTNAFSSASRVSARRTVAETPRNGDEHSVG